MKELLTSSLKLPSGNSHAAFAQFKHNGRSKNVCFNKNFRILNTSVHVTFCREMHNTVNIILLEYFHNSILYL